ncbi:MAG TPA: hypothetical protein ENJ50_01840 [Planctomycetaceae bacterium]|nr:hypothetical protein [Planctomycetaceae bacterium]
MADMVENGVTLENSVQVLGAGFATVGDFTGTLRKVRKATSAVDEAAEAASDATAATRKADAAVDSAAAAGKVDVPGGGAVGGVADDVLGQVDKILLERLKLGAQIEIPPGTQGIRKTMSDLSVVSGNEVALVRLRNGKRVLVMGEPNAVKLPPNTVLIIAHTHPKGSLRFSAADLRALNARGQRSSVLISPREDFGIRLPVVPGGN